MVSELCMDGGWSASVGILLRPETVVWMLKGIGFILPFRAVRNWT